MPLYDLTCPNKHDQHDVYLRIGDPRPPCPTCGEPTENLWERSASVIGDDIPGGYWVKHGICNPDGTPKKYYSKSEMRKAAFNQGLVIDGETPKLSRAVEDRQALEKEIQASKEKE